MKNSIKQLFRSPLKACILLIALSLSMIICILSLYLFLNSSEQMESLQSEFITIGTVEQKSDSQEQVEVWDWVNKEYTNYLVPSYTKILGEEIFVELNAPFLIEPTKRAYFGAKTDYVLQDNALFYSLSEYHPVVEFKVEEDCVPNEPVEITVTKILSGELTSQSTKKNENGETVILFCDVENESPINLEVGKTYVTSLRRTLEPSSGIEFFAGINWSTRNTQRDESGEQIESDILNQIGSIAEVDDKFYESDMGKYWLNLPSALVDLDKTLPVIATKSTALIADFHDKTAMITAGRDITSEEYESGAKTCLVPEEFMQNNNLNLGDKINLPLYFANENTSPTYLFSKGNVLLFDFLLLNAQGEKYEVFFEEEYEIVGIYNSALTASKHYTQTEIARDMIIIPQNSISESYENNLADFGTMKAQTTSFQIPNGSIGEFEKIFEENGINELFDISFDDRGYGEIKENLEQTRSFSGLLMIVGINVSIVVVIILIFFFVVKEQKRTVLEKAVGMSNFQCIMSILSAVLVVLALSILLAVASSYVLIYISNGAQSAELGYKYGYSTQFSIGFSDNEISVSENINLGNFIKVSTAVSLAITASITALSLIFIKKILRKSRL